MKHTINLFWLVPLFFGAAVLIYSCNKSSDVSSEVETVEKAEDLDIQNLVNAIEQLNASRFGEIETKAWNWRNIFAFGVDGAAGLLTALSTQWWTCVGSAVAASLGFVQLWNLLDTTEQLTPNEQSVIIPENYILDATNPQDAGYLHNIIICDLFNEYGDELGQMSLDSLMWYISLNIADYTNTPVSSIYSDLQDQQEIVEACFVDTGYCATLEDYIDDLSETFPDSASSLDVFSPILSGIEIAAANGEEEDYVDDVVTLIQTANVPLDFKTNLLAGVKIAAASEQLWQVSCGGVIEDYPGGGVINP